MECDEPELLAQWMARWEDLVRFEVVPVVTSADAAARVAGEAAPPRGSGGKRR
jgi:hypothetical protein